MKLSISNLAWEKDQDIIVASLLQKMKTDVEIAPTKVWEEPSVASDKTIKNYRRFWNDAGIKIVGLQSLLYGHPELCIFSNPNARKKTLDYLKRIISLASFLGAKVLVFGSPKNRDTYEKPKEEIENIAIEFFRSLGKTAGKYGVNFCIEANPSEYKCNFITNTSESLSLIEKIDSPNIKLNLDTACMTLAKDDPNESLKPTKKVLSHIHISEPFLSPVGTRKVEHKKFASSLKSINYKGYLSIEMLTINEKNNIETIKKSLLFVRKTYSS